MSDPYGHGETCDCARCVSFSEGLEAARPAPTKTLPREWLLRTTATSRDTFPGFQHLPTATGNWLTGFMLGLPDGERHARALDVILSSLDPYAQGARVTAIREARAYLALHALADFTPPPQRRNSPRRPT